MAGCSILCSIHSANETQPGRNSCPEFAIFGFQFGLYHVVVTFRFSFLRSVSLAVIVFAFLFLADQSYRSSYVHLQHYRSRSFAFSFHFQFFFRILHGCLDAKSVDLLSSRGVGALPSNRLMGMYCWMGSHFHGWIDYNGVAFSIELLEWGRIFSGF